MEKKKHWDKPYQSSYEYRPDPQNDLTISKSKSVIVKTHDDVKFLEPEVRSAFNKQLDFEKRPRETDSKIEF